MKKLILLSILLVVLILLIVSVFIANKNIKKRNNLLDSLPSANFNNNNNLTTTNKKVGEDKLMVGVGYMTKQAWIPKLYSDAGIKWIKAADVDWSKVEPKAPINGVHTYNTAIADRFIKAYQEKGFNIQVVLKSDTPWAVNLGDKNLGTNDFAQLIKSGPPSNEHLENYAKYIKYIVGRYNGDGIDDMPGLLKPIKYFEIESEAQHPFHWQGTVDQYITLLKTAYQAAKSVDPEAKIILSGMNFGDIFDDNPSQELIEQRINSLELVFKSGMEFIKKTLATEEYYDLVEFHYNRGIYGAEGTVNYIRQFTDKPIWGGDTSTGPWFFTKFTQPFGTQQQAEDLFKKIVKKQEPYYSEYQKDKSATVVKKFAVAADLGIERLIYETTNEWTGALNSSQVVDQIWYVMAIADNNGNPYPVYHTLKLLVDKADGFKTATKLQDYIYKFTFENKNDVYVAWSETGNKDIDLSNELGNTNVKVTYLINEVDVQYRPIVRNSISVPSDKIPITEEPVFIEKI